MPQYRGFLTDPTLVASCVCLPVLAVLYASLLLGVLADEETPGKKKKKKRRRWAFMSIWWCGIASWLLFFGACSWSFAVVKPFESNAARRAREALPPAFQLREEDYRYAKSWVLYGLFVTRCFGSGRGPRGTTQKKRLGCASDHLFSPVTPPEPPPVHDADTRAFVNFTHTRFCGKLPGKGDFDRNSWDFGDVKLIAPLFNAVAVKAQNAVMRAICGGKWRSVRALAGLCGFVGPVLHLVAVLMVAYSPYHLAACLLTLAHGTGGLVAWWLWKQLVDAHLKDAYPYREVRLGFGAMYFLCGSAILIAFATIGLLLLTASYLLHKRQQHTNQHHLAQVVEEEDEPPAHTLSNRSEVELSAPAYYSFTNRGRTTTTTGVPVVVIATPVQQPPPHQETAPLAYAAHHLAAPACHHDPGPGSQAQFGGGDVGSFGF